MKRTMIVALLIALFAINVTAIGGADVKASILRYEPTPAEQGNTVDVWIQLENRGTKAERVAIRFEPEYPFSLPPGQREEVDVGTISATEDIVERFTVYVDPAAPNGDQMITFWYKFSATNEWTQFEAPINIQTQNAVLIIDEYTVLPTPVVPGKAADLKLKVRNAGRIGIKNLDIALDLEENFATLGTGTKQRIDYVPAGETEEITFRIGSDTSTQVKRYNLPITLNFQDDRNKAYNDSAKVSLVVNAEPELSLTVDDTDFADKKSPGTVGLKVVNRGVVDLKYVTVNLQQSPDYNILSPSSEAYVGNLDNDDFETVDFIIEPNVRSPRLKINLEFKDPYNVDYSKNFDLPLRIITDADLGKGRSPIVPVVVILVIAGIIYWRFKKKKKSRKK